PGRLGDLAQLDGARVATGGHHLAHERLARDHAEEAAALADDEDGAYVLALREARGRRLRGVGDREHRRLRHHGVADRLRHGKIPRVSSAPPTSRIAATRAACRSVIRFSSATSHTRSNASLILSASRPRISSRSQKSRPRSCTHSKYDTVTPPALARMSRTAKIASASIVVGPFAPSTTSRVWTRPAFAPVSWSSRAATKSTSHGSSSSSSFVMRSQRS